MAHIHQQRLEALASFQRLVHTGERHRIMMQRANASYEEQWLGYDTPGLEKFRNGLGPENVEDVKGLRELRTQLIINESKWEDDEIERMMTLLANEKKALRRLLTKKAKEEKDLIDEDMALPTLKSRPTVTYMWRSAMK